MMMSMTMMMIMMMMRRRRRRRRRKRRTITIHFLLMQYTSECQLVPSIVNVDIEYGNNHRI